VLRTGGRFRDLRSTVEEMKPQNVTSGRPKLEPKTDVIWIGQGCEPAVKLKTAAVKLKTAQWEVGK
jgi:hypothetical protein